MTELMSILLALMLGGILFVLVGHSSHGWRGPTKSGARLPKGSFEWPILGESISFITNPDRFAASHIRRYGPIFKSNLYLRPTIFGAAPEFAKFICTNPQIFRSGWPPNVKVLGPLGFPFTDGPPHMTVKKLISKALRPKILLSQLDVLEAIIIRNLSSWAERKTVVLRETTQLITLDISFWLSLSAQNVGSTAEGRNALQNFRLLNKAFSSVPLNLPGTNYRKGMKAKKALTEYIKPILQRRKVEGKQYNDVMGYLLSVYDHSEEDMPEELKDFDDERIIETVVVLLFAAYDLTSTSLTWVLKHLIENPEVFRRVQAEHQKILNGRDPSVAQPRLTEDDFNNMEYTTRFFQEVLRITAISTLVPRKAVQDVEYKDVLISKGWSASFMLNALQSDPAVYPDPHIFNPDRFIVTPKPFHFLPFGFGTHGCPGGNAAKIASLIVIHHTTTTFSYESAGPDLGKEFNTFVNPVGGYLINIKRTAPSG